jgi:RNA polymerase sigma factor (sigma-70 family)
LKTGEISDEVLAKRFAEGDAKAMHAIYKMYFIHLSHFAYRITQNRAEAEDIAVVTLEFLLSRHADFVTMPNIKAFLFVTVRNKCLKYIAAEKRHRKSENELSTLQDEKDDYVLAQMVRSEFLMEVYREIESLPPVRKKVFKMLFIDGLTPQEIARQLGMSIEAVYNNKAKALKQLRNLLFDKMLMLVFWGLFIAGSYWVAVELPGYRP